MMCMCTVYHKYVYVGMSVITDVKGTYKCMEPCVSVCVCVTGYVSVCACVYVYMCVYIYVCVWVSVCICICAS